MKLHQQKLIFLLFASLTFFSSPRYVAGQGARCEKNGPTLQQREVSSGKFMVEVMNNCPTCPVIDIHLKCVSFPQALVNPRLLRVVASGDCVVNGGLPLQPLQKFSFNYSSSASSSSSRGARNKKKKKYLFQPSTWAFQCE